MERHFLINLAASNFSFSHNIIIFLGKNCWLLRYKCSWYGRRRKKGTVWCLHAILGIDLRWGLGYEGPVEGNKTSCQDGRRGITRTRKIAFGKNPRTPTMRPSLRQTERSDSVPVPTPFLTKIKGVTIKISIDFGSYKLDLQWMKHRKK